jgi:hypothetical protein
MIGSIAIGGLVKTGLEFVFDNPIGKMIAGGLLAVTVFGSWLLIHDHKVASAAKTEIIQETNKQAEELTDAAIKARAPSERSGAAERLRRNSCSDCDRKAAVPGSAAHLR